MHDAAAAATMCKGEFWNDPGHLLTNVYIDWDISNYCRRVKNRKKERQRRRSIRRSLSSLSNTHTHKHTDIAHRRFLAVQKSHTWSQKVAVKRKLGFMITAVKMCIFHPQTLLGKTERCSAHSEVTVGLQTWYYLNIKHSVWNNNLKKKQLRVLF